MRSALAALLLAATAPAHADVPPHLAGALADARPAGSGRLTWFGLHVYDARLYAAAPFDPGRFAEQPFALELTYARHFAGPTIAARSDAEMARLSRGTAEQRTRWRSQMAELFPDVQPGRRLAGVHRPGRGTDFFFDGRWLGRIDDPDFGPAFFAIWLDARTAAPELRAQLLEPVR